MIVLGLLLQDPDTPAGVAARLKERFASARFASSTAHTTCERLLAEGWIAVMPGEDGRPAARLQPTATGKAGFRDWLHRRSGVPPAVRDPTRAKLDLCESESDLRTLIASIEAEEEDCDRLHSRAHAEVITQRRRDARLGRDGTRDWRTSVRQVLLTDEATLWAQRAQRLHRLRTALEELLPELDRESRGAAQEEGWEKLDRRDANNAGARLQRPPEGGSGR